MKCLSTLIHSLNTYFTSFYFQNLKKQKYLFTSIVLRSSSYSTKIALKWTKIMLQSSVISIWNPQNQGYKIGNIYNYWDQPWSPKNGLEMLLRILSANTVQSRTLNFATSAGAMNRFAPTKVAKFNVRHCRIFFYKWHKKWFHLDMLVKASLSRSIKVSN